MLKYIYLVKCWGIYIYIVKKFFNMSMLQIFHGKINLKDQFTYVQKLFGILSIFIIHMSYELIVCISTLFLNQKKLFPNSIVYVLFEVSCILEIIWIERNWAKAISVVNEIFSQYDFGVPFGYRFGKIWIQNCLLGSLKFLNCFSFGALISFNSLIQKTGRIHRQWGIKCPLNHWNC